MEELDLVNKLDFLERHSRAFHSDIQLKIQRTAGDEPSRRLLEVHSTIGRINQLFLLAAEQLKSCLKGGA